MPTTTATRIGFVGLGHMGSTMAAPFAWFDVGPMQATQFDPERD